MRWTLLVTLTACGALAFDRAKQADASQTLGRIVAVKMTGDGTTKAAFEPHKLIITRGTTVRFINESGPPHNIGFWLDSIPKRAIEALKKGMPDAMVMGEDLMGPYLTKLNQTYDVSFAGVPAGVYKGHCMPHEALGMHITIIVK